jgi:selenocysteine-specific elongation factor
VFFVSFVVPKEDVTTRHFIIATAGHVDHGKSALVKALTGTDPDRLPEEKARQITIDLGFAELNLPGGIHAGIVDVPGHEDFVRNMIAGVGSIDLALFVVAADDGWMPQSEEHLQILTYLGVRRAVIALTKTDLTTFDLEQLRHRLNNTPFAGASIIPTSVRTGEGLHDLKNALADQLNAMQPQRDYGKPRLFVDRVFTLRGIGTVVTGTLTGGEFHHGQKIIAQPGGLESRIRSIQSHNRELELARPGMRTAINLPDIDVEQVKRGDVITIAELGQPSANLLVQIDSPISLKTRSAAWLHHGTSRVPARILSLQKNGVAHMKLASPIFAFLGDRVVLRDPSERRTIGGAVILDPDGHKCGNVSPVPNNIDLRLRAEISARGFVQKQALLRRSQFSADEIADALCRLENARHVSVHREFVADPAAWEKLRNGAIALIDAAHSRNPERAGLDLSELRAALRDLSDEMFEALTADLSIADFVRTGSTIARKTHLASLPSELTSAEKKIREALTRKPFDPPSRREIETDGQARQVLRFLIESRQAIEISPEVLVLSTSFAAMKDVVVDFIFRNGPTTVSELRQALGSSRRVIVPFLERLDRDGITRRVGEKRLLR